jgi:glutamate-ammonia-ligase adenylyltransferase
VEAFVQRLQLEHGGAEPTLRTPNVLDALGALRRAGLLDEESARALEDSYGWLRRAEHFLQLVSQRPAREFPSSPEAQLALARCMGYREPEGRRARERLLGDWRAVGRELQQHLPGRISPIPG